MSTDITAADKLLTEIVRLRRLVKRIGERLERLGDPDHSDSIDEFCAREHMSRRQYYKLRAAGKGPREMRHADQLIRISPEARRDWRRAREAAVAAGEAGTKR